MPKTRTRDLEHWVPRLAEAGLAGDYQVLENILVTLIRRTRTESPELSNELGAVLARHTTNNGALRWSQVGPPPTESEEGFALVKTEVPDQSPAPIFTSEVFEPVNQFLRERCNSERLFREGFLPPSSLLLTGEPGTGKTMLARWLASVLELPLLVQDLAVSISSYLGKTGFNLRRTLDYARGRPCVLLLDEFDAIAKRRNDDSELGELKRIVNVILKELEDWPSRSVIVAATNHPALLDKAIARRFHVIIDLPLPGHSERYKILERAGARFSDDVPREFLAACATLLQGRSGSDIESLMQAAVRRHLATDTTVVQSIVLELLRRSDRHSQARSIGYVVRALQKASANKFSVRELASLFDRSVSTIQHHLRKDEDLG